MKATVEVANKGEVNAVQAAMADQTTRAVVLTMGALMQLPNTRIRKRVLAFVSDQLDDADEAKVEAAGG